MEHLAGTAAALSSVGLAEQTKKRPSGDQIGALNRRAGRAPGSLLQIEVPLWLVNDEAHREAATLELQVYERILTSARSLSTEREKRKLNNFWRCSKATSK